MTILTALSHSGAKDSRVDVVDGCKENGKGTVEDLSSPMKFC